ncbi:hypothetical protein FB45DRAFT_222606 [Roridomyces roridus]|uniref:Uncharacterized protein n=1 Tax=Roridomyces roridus TaxID=1738132 RepID=A0AAD7BCQ3_9AGAR|nr:hypothetical protein FB45DRAFT_222606 [Roridomyces roridus]
MPRIRFRTARTEALYSDDLASRSHSTVSEISTTPVYAAADGIITADGGTVAIRDRGCFCLSSNRDITVSNLLRILLTPHLAFPLASFLTHLFFSFSMERHMDYTNIDGDGQTFDVPLPAPHTVWVVPHCADLVYERTFPLPLPGTDRINFVISISDIFAGRLEEERLIESFQDALTFYPHASGRLRRKGDDWSLGAGKRGVPILFETIEDPLDHYQVPSIIPPEIIDVVSTDIAGATEPEWDEPMLRIKVTYCPKSNESSIGFSASHMLGDGEFVFQFMCAWSQYYQNKKPFFGAPSYEKFRNALPPLEHNDGNPETAAFIQRYLPHLKELHPMDDFLSMIGEAFANSTLVDLLFTKEQIGQLKAIADSWPGREGAKTSPHDAISGYLISTINRCLKTPITRVSSIFSYRGIKNPENLKPGDWRIPGPLAIGNAMFHALTPTLSLNEASSIGALALAIRKSVKETRNYEHIKRIVAVSEPIWMRQSQERSEHKFWDDSTLVMNTMGKADFSLQHFGFGRRYVRTHCYGDFPGFARCFKAPPSKQADGTWNSNEDAIWMFVRIPTEIHQEFMALIAADLNSSEFPENLVKREREVQARIGVKARL